MRDAFSLKNAACHDNYMILHAGFCIVFCFLVPAEDITGVDFAFYRM